MSPNATHQSHEPWNTDLLKVMGSLVHGLWNNTLHSMGSLLSCPFCKLQLHFSWVVFHLNPTASSNCLFPIRSLHFFLAGSTKLTKLAFQLKTKVSILFSLDFSNINWMGSTWYSKPPGLFYWLFQLVDSKSLLEKNWLEITISIHLKLVVWSSR